MATTTTTLTNAERLKQYRNDNPHMKTVDINRRRITKFLERKGMEKRTSVEIRETLGLSIDDFYKWIRFNVVLDNLDSNYQMDHINPLTSFDVNCWDDIVESEMNHWTNIMAVSKSFNLSKGNKEPEEEYIEKCKTRIRMFIISRRIKEEL